MDMLEHLRRQLAYDAWANREVLAAIKVVGPEFAPEQALKLLAHILSAERLWLERLRQQPQSLPVWPAFNFDQCEAQTDELIRLWNEYFADLSSSALAQGIPYKNSKGEVWSSTVQDVLTHIVLHSAYHRGQIAAVMRAGGHVPAYTDFIHALRQGLIE
jgi:uncharacterized damage-inducible protein DinB